MKVARYARYSSDNQRDASMEDQLRLCRLHAEKQGWTVVDSCTDRAISGASLLRPGIQELISDQLRNVVVSRFERHLADDPLSVMIVDLIDSAWFLPNTQPLNFVVVATA
ncbi:DNA invertase Pin-like site-specific DNA recombinase [Bradyrhizobium sp. USDA 3650]